MTAFDDFAKERAGIDALLDQGFTVAGMAEDLDGAAVTFTGGTGVTVELRLLTADARKYVTTRILAAYQEAARPQAKTAGSSA
ncbi:hypothetical protein [Paenibacillus sp. NFR01]|uniref:hypothetical protein n=1 Tax=Paenibacillus sp. NFR01 TaxID=1566279 RepID=UPI0008D7815E|nr:hypothetical protein [Paenibacillus sp. NFR01]SEU12212.1 hypothetical protein SAMN03159358_3449 [Paenibacillus sp. NFR01]